MSDIPCPTCTGVPHDPFHTKKCEVHDVCERCGTKRCDLDDIPWWTRTGILCKPCDLTIKQDAIDVFNPSDYDELDYQFNSFIKCPFCGKNNETDGDDYREEGKFETECSKCASTIAVEVCVDVTWSTSKPETSPIETKES